MRKLRHGSLFTGVGGMDLGLEWAGFETVWQVEIDPFARKVLEKHWSGVKRLDDVRKCGRHNLEPVEIITAGFPCQQVSCAGKREGIGTPDSPTERSGLWFQVRRVVAELSSGISALTKSSLTWKPSATPAGRLWWALESSERRTRGNGCGFSATTMPVASATSKP